MNDMIEDKECRKAYKNYMSYRNRKRGRYCGVDTYELWIFACKWARNQLRKGL